MDELECVLARTYSVSETHMLMPLLLLRSKIGFRAGIMIPMGFLSFFERSVIKPTLSKHGKH